MENTEFKITKVNELGGVTVEVWKEGKLSTVQTLPPSAIPNAIKTVSGTGNLPTSAPRDIDEFIAQHGGGVHTSATGTNIILPTGKPADVNIMIEPAAQTKTVIEQLNKVQGITPIKTETTGITSIPSSQIHYEFYPLPPKPNQTQSFTGRFYLGTPSPDYSVEAKFREMAMTMESRPLDVFTYGVFYNPFGFRESIAAVSARLEGKTQQEAWEAAFQSGRVSFYKEAYYNPVGFAAQSAFSGALYGIGGASMLAPEIAKIGDIIFKGAMTYQTFKFVEEPSLEKGLNLAIGAGMYSLIKLGANKISSYMRKDIEIPVEYTDKRALIAQKVERNPDMLAGKTKITNYYSYDTKDMANARIIQEEQFGVARRTTVTQYGKMISEPKGDLNFEWEGINIRTVSYGTGEGFSLSNRILLMNGETVVTNVPELSPINRRITIGTMVNEKEFLKLVNPADIKKTPLSQTFPMPEKPPEYFETISSSGYKVLGAKPITILKTAALNIETFKETSIITAYSDKSMANIFQPFITLKANKIDVKQNYKYPEKEDIKTAEKTITMTLKKTEFDLKERFNLGTEEKVKQEYMQTPALSQSQPVALIQEQKQPEALKQSQFFMFNQRMMSRGAAMNRYDYLVDKKMVEPIIDEETSKGWLSWHKKDMISIGKPSKLGREKWVLVPQTDWLSRIQTEMQLGKKATNVPNKPKYRKAFAKEFYGNPLGLFAGRMPSMEMIKEFKIKV